MTDYHTCAICNQHCRTDFKCHTIKHFKFKDCKDHTFDEKCKLCEGAPGTHGCQFWGSPADDECDGCGSYDTHIVCNECESGFWYCSWSCYYSGHSEFTTNPVLPDEHTSSAELTGQNCDDLRHCSEEPTNINKLEECSNCYGKISAKGLLCSKCKGTRMFCSNSCYFKYHNNIGTEYIVHRNDSVPAKKGFNHLKLIANTKCDLTGETILCV